VKRPAPDEYPPYFHGYIEQVPAAVDAIAFLHTQRTETCSLLERFGEEHGQLSYAQGKWSVKEVLGHVIDIERAFGYRAMRIGRGDETPLPGIDHDVLMAGVRFDDRSLASLVEEYRCVRAASLTLFESFDERALQRRGQVDGTTLSARAIIHIVAGHDRHHMNVVVERYLQALS